MDGEEYDRHLVAILAADLVGYSRLMGHEEGRTLSRLKRALTTIIAPAIKNNNGRLVKTIGDGLIAEFGSVVNAITCAIEIQRDIGENQKDEPDDTCLKFRIGINLGDVIYDGEDIFGDGVNVAARLETVAKPSEICVSGAVRDAVRGKMKIALDDRGEQAFKNISDPVHVYAVIWDAAEWQTRSMPQVRRPGALAARPKGPFPAIVYIALAGLCAVLAGVIGVRALHAPPQQPVTAVATSTPAAAKAVYVAPLQAAHPVVPQHVSGPTSAPAPLATPATTAVATPATVPSPSIVSPAAPQAAVVPAANTLPSISPDAAVVTSVATPPPASTATPPP
jgi:class 3 adenylate cyclase